MNASTARSAFAFYLALGRRRSLHVVAEQVNLTAAELEKLAADHRWDEHIAAIEDYALRYTLGELGVVKNYAPEFEFVDELFECAMECLRRYPLLHALECIDRSEAEERVARTRVEPSMSEDEALDFFDQFRGAVLADRRRHGTPELAEEDLM